MANETTTPVLIDKELVDRFMELKGQVGVTNAEMFELLFAPVEARAFQSKTVIEGRLGSRSPAETVIDRRFAAMQKDLHDAASQSIKVIKVLNAEIERLKVMVGDTTKRQKDHSDRITGYHARFKKIRDRRNALRAKGEL